MTTITMIIRTAIIATLSALLTITASALPLFTSESQLPNNGQWQSLPDGNEIQLAADYDHRALHVGTSNFESMFVDGSETYYDPYAQAWRLLGMYIDCNALQETDEHEKGSGCQRFLLWAAYVDLDYSGGGIGEYMYWDRKNKRWDDTACKHHGGSRCVKMDCHLPQSTNFALLGYFKEANYEEWMEQLFKHEGVCVWTDEEYSFMQADREAWPQSCTETKQKDENGNTLYIDAKPIAGGGMSIGLYTDYRCSKDYTGDQMQLEDVLMSYYGEKNGDDYYHNTYQLSEYLDTWNAAFDIYHYCQPCKAYNLLYIPSENYNQTNRYKKDEDYSNNNNNKNKNNNNYKEYSENGDDDNDANHGYFTCDDDANYHNVNQCMKFRTKTKMLTATYSDILLAQQQGTITDAGHGGVVYRSKSEMAQGINSSLGAFVGSMVVLAFGLTLSIMTLRKAGKNYYKAKSSFKEPLMVNDKGVAV